MSQFDARPWMIPVGGFLGAGKTTLILAAARILSRQGFRCAAVLNDQGLELVDTNYVRAQGIAAAEVGGACFCCRFSDLIDSAEELCSLAPNVIFLEPVGSCTDLSATILQPLKRGFCDRYRLAPLTVLVDPERARQCSQSGRNFDIGFLFDHQISEADIIAFTKCDRYTQFPALCAPRIRYLSALTGQGVAAWLDEVLSSALAVGQKLLDIDYAQYARAEAALGWLNWAAEIHLGQAIPPLQLIGPLMDELQRALTQASAAIVHLKILDETPASYLKAAITDNQSEPSMDGDLTASPEQVHEVRVNVRAVVSPATLREIFESQLVHIPGVRRNERLQCFSPAAPQPEQRSSEVIF